MSSNASPPTLSERQRRHLRGLAHDKKPVVMIGQSALTDAIVGEMETALGAHELIKVRARVGDRDARDAIFDSLALRTASALVQRIGNVAVYFRARKENSKIILPAD